MLMRKQYQWIQAVVLLLIVFAVYVAKINHTAGIDEIMTFFKYTRSLPDVLLYDAPNNHILHSILVWLSTSLLGNSLIAIRLPAFMAGIVSLALAYRMSKRWGNHHIALIAIMLMSITQDFVSYTVDGRGYTLTIMLAILLVETVPVSQYVISWKTGDYAFILSVGILLLIPSNAFLLVSIIVWVFLSAWRLQKRSLLINSLPYILGLVVCGTFYAIQLITRFPNGLSQEFYVGFRNLNGFIYQSVITLFDNPLFYILLLGVFLWGVVVTFLQYRKPRFIFIACIFVVVGLLTLAQWVITNRLFFPRNYLYLVPFISMIGAIGIYRFSMLRINVIIPVVLLIGGLWGTHTSGHNTHILAQLNAIEENALDGDILFVGAGYFDPIYYHIRLQNVAPRDYFVSSNQSDRFALMPTSMDIDTIIDIHGLEPYIEQCSEESWDDYTVYTCPIVDGPYTSDSSRCFVSVYPYWRDCGEEDVIQSSG